MRYRREIKKIRLEIDLNFLMKFSKLIEEFMSPKQRLKRILKCFQEFFKKLTQSKFNLSKHQLVLYNLLKL